MSQAPDSAVRTYIEQHRAAFLDDLAEWLRIPSVSARPDHAPSVRHSADRLAAKLKETGFPATEPRETPGAPPAHPWLLVADAAIASHSVAARGDGEALNHPARGAVAPHAGTAPGVGVEPSAYAWGDLAEHWRHAP